MKNKWNIREFFSAFVPVLCVGGLMGVFSRFADFVSVLLVAIILGILVGYFNVQIVGLKTQVQKLEEKIIDTQRNY